MVNGKKGFQPSLGFLIFCCVLFGVGGAFCCIGGDSLAAGFAPDDPIQERARRPVWKYCIDDRNGGDALYVIKDDKRVFRESVAALKMGKGWRRLDKSEKLVIPLQIDRGVEPPEKLKRTE